MLDVHQVRRLSAMLTARIATAPIPHIDRYLLVLRWVAILGLAAIILARGTAPEVEQAIGKTFISPLLALPAAIGYNLLISIFIRQKQPLARGQVSWLIPGDLLQAALFTALTGGINSLFFIFFPIVIIEMALTFYWQAALVQTVGVCLLHVIIVILNLTSGLDSLTIAILTAKSFVILILGALVTLYSHQMRREESVRRGAARAVSRATILNEIFLRFGESRLEPASILATTLEGTRLLSSLAFSLALLPGSDKSCWQVAASTTTRHPVGKQITEPQWEQIDQPIFYAGAGQALSLPEFIVDDNADQLVCARLSTPGGDTLGMIVVGRQTDRPMSDDEQAFLRALAIEAGLALRNAQLYAREQEQVARLRRFEELQSIFFSAIGHELKTPLTVLKTLVPSLRQLPELPVDTQAEIAETIEQNLTRLELLINDLLESSRLEAEAVALHTRSINLVNRVQRVLDSWAPLLDRKRQQVSLKTGPDLPRVWAEGRRVEQILSNLMNNAAKFAPPDSTIEVELGSVDDVVQVCVVDAGPGVPPEEQARVFEKFYIAAKDKALAGVGLGLFICRELVRLHGGRIWIEDRPGGGSRFCFTLPRADKVTSDEESRP